MTKQDYRERQSYLDGEKAKGKEICGVKKRLCIDVLLHKKPESWIVVPSWLLRHKNEVRNYSSAIKSSRDVRSHPGEGAQ